jgi:hypothetical protein
VKKPRPILPKWNGYTRLLSWILISLSSATILIANRSSADDEAKPEAATPPAPKNTAWLTDEQQKAAAIQVESPAPTHITPEVKGYGRVVDPAALAGMIGDFTTARAASAGSQSEFKRLKTLAAQNNASAKAIEDAEAASARDQAQLDAARLKLLGSWGQAIAGRNDLPAFMESLGNMESALVRIDLPAGETLKFTPEKARLMTLDNRSIEASYLGAAPSVDPQTQSEGFLFLVESNSLKLGPGAAVVGYLQSPGESQSGFAIPSSAILRYEGATWIYLQTGTTNFVRHTISLEQPLDKGWFVSSGVSAEDKIVVTGTQSVLSQELNGTGFTSGRD